MIRTDELFHALRNRIAFLPGSRDRSRHPIIFLPFENQNSTIDQLRAVLFCLIDWTFENDRQNGFIFIIDMRNGATGNTLKSLLKTFEEEFKKFLAAVFIIKPEKFWEKHKASGYKWPLFFRCANNSAGSTNTDNRFKSNYSRTTESIRLKGSEMVHQFEEYSKEIRNCLMPSDLNGHSPDQYFQVLRSIESGLQAIRSDTIDNAINLLNERLTSSASHSQNPDFINIIPSLRHLANQISRVRKEVYDRLNEKRRELDRGSQLMTFENEATHTMKFLVSYIDQITKVAYEIGKNEEQAKQLARSHKDLMNAVNRIEPTYKHVLDTGQRLLNSNAGVDVKVKNYLRPLETEWVTLHRKMEERNALLENALKFHASYCLYQKQATDWIASAGSNQPEIIGMSEDDLIQNNSKLQATREQWEVAYSETLSYAVDLRKKLEHRGHGDNHYASEIMASIDNITRLNRQLNNVLESRHLSVRQRLQFLVLLPEIETVIKWLDEHGEPFLKRKIAIGHDNKSAKSLADHHEKFCEIASLTYQNAKKLFIASRDVINHGEADVQTINEQVHRLELRINRFHTKS
ncbi:CRAL-TRIO domain-containing protein [Aphelenchoides bicaudatus]|nr:CRAL-TRIO domain-containing protein [Aphelenchoides bicaudatus]